MARAQFTLNTDPHVAEVGDTELRFRPEVMGDEYLDAFEEMQDANRAAGVLTDDGHPADGATIAGARESRVAARRFLTRLMLEESAEEFADMELPDRVLGELVQWVTEVYGGNRPPTSPNDSARPSPPAGTSGRGASRSKGATRTRGR
ncbi:hypothetical protein [Streptomyces sulphureus]|uniref:hypothetical protein n=1 Tax=Streptomyces sulphureus TaxID=47758 RepID=UPI00036ED645|nr:hypothetical protein [Streptomyces sulphureus]